MKTTHKQTFLFESIKAHRLPIRPQQLSMFSSGVRGEQRVTVRELLKHMGQEEQYDSLHSRLNLGIKQTY